jgi:hypothetical protein
MLMCLVAMTADIVCKHCDIADGCDANSHFQTFIY